MRWHGEVSWEPGGKWDLQRSHFSPWIGPHMVFLLQLRLGPPIRTAVSGAPPSAAHMRPYMAYLREPPVLLRPDREWFLKFPPLPAPLCPYMAYFLEPPVLLRPHREWFLKFTPLPAPLCPYMALRGTGSLTRVRRHARGHAGTRALPRHFERYKLSRN